MYYEIYQSGSEWRWRLKARNHRVIASGEGYKNRADCLRCIALIKEASYAVVLHRHRDGKVSTVEE